MIAEMTNMGFPSASDENSEITSPKTPFYNCIAWAANDNTKWWWPSPNSKQSYWPPGAPRSITVESFIAAFQTLGYMRCDSGELQSGIEKVVLYVDSEGKPTHMARQLSNGLWTSKMGKWHDISHMEPENLNGPVYGSPYLYMGRAISSGNIVH